MAHKRYGLERMNMLYTKKRRLANVLITFTCSLILFLIFYYRSNGSLASGADDAFLAQLLSNISSTGEPTSNVSAAVAEFFEKYLGKDAEFICNTDNFNGYISDEFNYFKWHPYLILYFLSPFSLFLGAENVLALASTISVGSLLLFSLLFMKRNNNYLFPFVLFFIIIFSLPHLKGIIFGQNYVDRLFIGIFPAWAYFVTDNQNKSFTRKLSILVTSLLFISLSERFALIFSIIVVYMISTKLIRIKSRSEMCSILALVCTAIVVVFAEINFITYDANDSFGNSILNGIKAFPVNFTDPSPLLIFFALINIVPFIILIRYSPKWYALAFIFMLPNILGNIGGAEKMGYYTHYHSIYLPILAIAISTSLSRFSYKSNYIYSAVYVLGCLFLGLSISLSSSYYSSSPISQKKIVFSANPSTIGRTDELLVNISHLNIPKNSLLVGLFTKQAQAKAAYNSRHVLSKELREINIPTDSYISTIEPAFISLYKNYRLFLYPGGIDTADYLLLKIENNKSIDLQALPKYQGAVSYHGQEDAYKMNTCLIKKAGKKGFDMKNPILLKNNYALIEKIL